jgi:hypothetical protein
MHLNEKTKEAIERGDGLRSNASMGGGGSLTDILFLRRGELFGSFICTKLRSLDLSLFLGRPLFTISFSSAYNTTDVVILFVRRKLPSHSLPSLKIAVVVTVKSVRVTPTCQCFNNKNHTDPQLNPRSS